MKKIIAAFEVACPICGAAVNDDCTDKISSISLRAWPHGKYHVARVLDADDASHAYNVLMGYNDGR